ncbi:MAG: helix-turn-helix transcriptional regulator [Succiniclasticum sp.]|uniref:helix-turn-helix domain-containing protein n=1 Tax=Succiniclasticum sp. TaxID=2775030 RepID=UPI002A91B8D1|nr:helix-turn-helix transcriptional regulator [Succiniclasticum sp.]MDY6290702.1 helix-turn-helix transcriptional regulator [Succiniclasticum sp.]
MKGRKPNPNRPWYASAIAEARMKKGWTQAQLGEAVGKDGATIKKYEGGSRVPPFDVLYDICKVLGIDVFDVMDLDLRYGYSTGYHQFVDEPFSDAVALLSDDISIGNLSEMGIGTDDQIYIHYGDKEGYTSKMTFILEVQAIKRRLKEKYYEELSKEVSQLAKDIVDGKEEMEDVEAVSLAGEKTIIKVRKPKF